MPIRKKCKLGDYLVQCDRTGFTRWASETRKEWNGLRVWDRVYEERNAQDFIRGLPDDMSVPDARPEGTAQFIGPLVTEVNADHSAGATSITVLDTSRMAASDSITIVLDNTDILRTTISTVDDATTLTIADRLPFTTSAGNKVTDYTQVSSATIE